MTVYCYDDKSWVSVNIRKRPFGMIGMAINDKTIRFLREMNQVLYLCTTYCS